MFAIDIVSWEAEVARLTPDDPGLDRFAVMEIYAPYSYVGFSLRNGVPVTWMHHPDANWTGYTC